MPSKIRILSEHTINQIAAGEVIENPASVVKELVENSIDAGSTEICVEISVGGRQLIRITDNGSGMNADDALLCLERHATSKIKNVEDIHSLLTMGFRGEAVPSIASISKFTLLTCEQGASMGTMVIVDGGRVVQCTPAARSPGTTIEVKALFFNVPVRKKFQKSPNYDANEILKMLTTIALGHPHIKFELIHNQQTLLNAPVAKGGTFLECLGERLGVILGSDFFESTCPIQGRKDGYEIQGYVGLPGISRQNRTGQFLFINNRGIYNPLIAYTIRDGYGTTLSNNRHPIYVLHVKIPGDLVDVNVHPQKREVRLRQEQSLKELIHTAIHEALQNSGVSFSLPTEEEPMQPMPSFVLPPAKEEPNQSYAFTPRRFEKPFSDFVVPEVVIKREEVPQPQLSFDLPEPQVNLKIIATIQRYIIIDAAGLIRQANSPFRNSSNVVMALIDQKAAHSRIIFEKLMQSDQLAVQTLLIPFTIEATPLEAALIVEQMDYLNKMGIQIHQSGPVSFIVDALPQVFGNVDVQTLITDLVHQLRDYNDTNQAQKEKEKRLAISASRAAVSQSRKLTFEEAQSLVNQLMQCQAPYQCPQGKPTIAPISMDELAKHFQRG